MQARWEAARANYDAVREFDASPRHVEKAYALLVELAGLSRQLDVARRDVLLRWLRLNRRKRLLRRVARTLLAVSLSAAILLARGCGSAAAGLPVRFGRGSPPGVLSAAEAAVGARVHQLVSQHTAL